MAQAIGGERCVANRSGLVRQSHDLAQVGWVSRGFEVIDEHWVVLEPVHPAQEREPDLVMGGGWLEKFLAELLAGCHDAFVVGSSVGSQTSEREAGWLSDPVEDAQERVAERADADTMRADVCPARRAALAGTVNALRVIARDEIGEMKVVAGDEASNLDTGDATQTLERSICYV